MVPALICVRELREGIGYNYGMEIRTEKEQIYLLMEIRIEEECTTCTLYVVGIWCIGYASDRLNSRGEGGSSMWGTHSMQHWRLLLASTAALGLGLL